MNLKLITAAMALTLSIPAFANRELTFYEGFEGRTAGYLNQYEKDFASNVWLPDGWSEFSKIEGHKNYPDIPMDDIGDCLEWDYTWCTKPSSFLYGSTPYGGAYAHIMTHNWSVGQDTTPKESDEWLVTPTIKVQDSDVLSFAVCFNPYLTIRPDADGKPTEKTNVLEVRISTDNGETWSEPLWNSYDETLTYSIDELVQSIISYDWINQFKTIFVELDPYYGKDVKIAFRYYGKNGADISLDEVSVGIPYPKASYDLPESYLWPALTEKVDLPKAPLAFAAAGTEHTWTNTSVNAKTFDWTYGLSSTSDERDLVTPAYEDGTITPFPTLNSRYGENASGVWSLVNNPAPYMQAIGAAEPKIQYGGSIGTVENTDGTECRGGVATYNMWDPEMLGVKHQQGIAISAMAEMMFDNRYTNGTVRNWDFLQSIGTIYPKPESPYGVDYVYANVIIENIDPDSKLMATIHPWETEIVAGQETSYAGDPLATAPVTYNPADVGAGVLTTIMFDFKETPVTVETPYIILISGFKRNEAAGSGRPEIVDNIRFPYILSSSKKYYGTSIATFKEYEANIGGYYPAYAHLGTIQGAEPDTHVAGLLMGVGITNSTMTLEGSDNTIVAEAKGGSKSFIVSASTNPETWRLVEGLRPCDWATFTTTEKTDGTYEVTINVAENTGTARDTQIRLASSGSYVTFNVKQEGSQSGIISVTDGNADAPAEYYNLQGVRVENPRHGVFIRRQGAKTEKVILK